MTDDLWPYEISRSIASSCCNAVVETCSMCATKTMRPHARLTLAFAGQDKVPFEYLLCAACWLSHGDSFFDELAPREPT